MSKLPQKSQIVVLLCVFSCGPADTDLSSGTANTQAGQISPSSSSTATLVRVGNLERGEIRTTIDVTCDIEAEERVSIYAKVGPAYIQEMKVDEGSQVKAGEPLVILNPTDFKIAVRRSESKLKQAQTEVIRSEVLLKESRARQTAQKAMFERSMAEHERAQNAMKGGVDVLSRKEITDAEKSYQQAQAEYEASKLLVEQSVAELELRNLESRAAEIELESAQNDLSETTVRSPIGGVVQDRLVDSGLLVSSSTQLLTVIDPTNLIANLRIPQEDLLLVNRVGLAVEFLFDALPGRTFQGKVEAINPAVDPASGLIKIRVRLLSEALGSVRPGMFARAQIVVESHSDAFLLSKRSVVYEEGLPLFFTVLDGKAKKHFFEPGASTESQVEVIKLDGQSDGDGAPDWESLKVILVGQDRLRDGDQVKVVEESR